MFNEKGAMIRPFFMGKVLNATCPHTEKAL